MARVNTEPVQFEVPTGTKERIKERAGSLGFTLAQYLRHLVEQDIQAVDREFSLNVEWGGDRRSKTEDTHEE